VIGPSVMRHPCDLRIISRRVAGVVGRWHAADASRARDDPLSVCYPINLQRTRRSRLQGHSGGNTAFPPSYVYVPEDRGLSQSATRVAVRNGKRHCTVCAGRSRLPVPWGKGAMLRCATPLGIHAGCHLHTGHRSRTAWARKVPPAVDTPALPPERLAGKEHCDQRRRCPSSPVAVTPRSTRPRLPASHRLAALCVAGTRLCRPSAGNW
jgi:hypothetical protein